MRWGATLFTIVIAFGAAALVGALALDKHQRGEPVPRSEIRFVQVSALVGFSFVVSSLLDWRLHSKHPELHRQLKEPGRGFFAFLFKFGFLRLGDLLVTLLCITHQVAFYAVLYLLVF